MMKKKLLMVLLFAMGLSASYSYAQDETTACTSLCILKYDDCLTKSWIDPGLCSTRFQICLADCTGDGGLQ